MAKYWGIASSNGLESFMFEPTTGSSGLDQLIHGEDTQNVQTNIEEEKKAAFQSVYWNRHRHSVLYEAIIDAKDAAEIRSVMNNDPSAALLMLKDKAKKIMIAQMRGNEKSWDLIPNPDLDPHS